jgi:hypothetical protein
MRAYRDRDISWWFRYAPENRRGYSTTFPLFSAPCKNESPRGKPRGIADRNPQELRGKPRGIHHPAKAV